MGILEGIAEQLRQLQETVSQFVAEMRVSAPPTYPLTAAKEIWANGEMDVLDAVAFSGISRNELFIPMHDGELSFATPTCGRLVPQRWLGQYLAKYAGSS